MSNLLKMNNVLLIEQVRKQESPVILKQWALELADRLERELLEQMAAEKLMCHLLKEEIENASIHCGGFDNRWRNRPSLFI